MSRPKGYEIGNASLSYRKVQANPAREFKSFERQKKEVEKRARLRAEIEAEFGASQKQSVPVSKIWSTKWNVQG